MPKQSRHLSIIRHTSKSSVDIATVKEPLGSDAYLSYRFSKTYGAATVLMFLEPRKRCRNPQLSKAASRPAEHLCTSIYGTSFFRALAGLGCLNRGASLFSWVDLPQTTDSGVIHPKTPKSYPPIIPSIISVSRIRGLITA